MLNGYERILKYIEDLNTNNIEEVSEKIRQVCIDCTHPNIVDVLTPERMCKYFTNAIINSIDNNYPLVYDELLNSGHVRFITWEISKEEMNKIRTYTIDDYLPNILKSIYNFIDTIVKIELRNDGVNNYFGVQDVDCLVDIETGDTLFKTCIYIK